MFLDSLPWKCKSPLPRYTDTCKRLRYTVQNWSISTVLIRQNPLPSSDIKFFQAYFNTNSKSPKKSWTIIKHPTDNLSCPPRKQDQFCQAKPNPRKNANQIMSQCFTNSSRFCWICTKGSFEMVFASISFFFVYVKWHKFWIFLVK